MLFIVELSISFNWTPWKNSIWTTQTKIFRFHHGKIIKYTCFQKPKSSLKELDGKPWSFQVNQNQQKKKHGFKSRNCPPIVEEAAKISNMTLWWWSRISSLQTSKTIFKQNWKMILQTSRNVKRLLNILKGSIYLMIRYMLIYIWRYSDVF